MSGQYGQSDTIGLVGLRRSVVSLIQSAQLVCATVSVGQSSTISLVVISCGLHHSRCSKSSQFITVGARHRRCSDDNWWVSWIEPRMGYRSLRASGERSSDLLTHSLHGRVEREWVVVEEGQRAKPCQLLVVYRAMSEQKQRVLKSLPQTGDWSSKRKEENVPRLSKERRETALLEKRKRCASIGGRSSLLAPTGPKESEKKEEEGKGILLQPEDQSALARPVDGSRVVRSKDLDVVEEHKTEKEWVDLFGGSTDLEGKIDAIVGLRKLLSVEKQGEDLSVAVLNLFDTGFLQGLIEAMVKQECGLKLVPEYLWIVQNVCSTDHCEYFVKHGGCKMLAVLLQARRLLPLEALDSLLCCIGNVAFDNRDYRSRILSDGFLEPLIVLAQELLVVHGAEGVTSRGTEVVEFSLASTLGGTVS